MITRREKRSSRDAVDGGLHLSQCSVVGVKSVLGVTEWSGLVPNVFSPMIC